MIIYKNTIFLSKLLLWKVLFVVPVLFSLRFLVSICKKKISFLYISGFPLLRNRVVIKQIISNYFCHG